MRVEPSGLGLVPLQKKTLGLPWWLNGKESACQCRRFGFSPWVGKIPWRKEWQPTPVFLPGKSHGQRSLAGYSSWGHKEPTQFSNSTTRAEETSQSQLFPSAVWEYTEIYLGSRVSPDHDIAGAMILNFLVSRTVRNKCLLFISHAIHGRFVIAAWMDQDKRFSKYN